MCAVLFKVALGSSQGQLQTRLWFCSEFYFKTFITQKYVAYIALKRTFLIKSVYNYYTKRYQRPLSPPERGYKAVLENGFHAVEFGFQILDSGFFVAIVWGIPDSTSKKFADSGIWIPSKLATFWLILWTFSLQQWWTCQFSLLFLTVLFIIPNYLIVTWCFLFQPPFSVRKVHWNHKEKYQVKSAFLKSL